MSNFQKALKILQTKPGSAIICTNTNKTSYFTKDKAYHVEGGAEVPFIIDDEGDELSLKEIADNIINSTGAQFSPQPTPSSLKEARLEFNNGIMIIKNSTINIELHTPISIEELQRLSNLASTLISNY